MKLIISTFCMCLALLSQAQEPSTFVKKNQGAIPYCPSPEITAMVNIPDTLWAKSPGQFACQNENLNYTWIFDDGLQAEGRTVSHTYNFVGIYAVKLVVSNGLATDTISKNVLVMPAKRQRNTNWQPKQFFSVTPNPATGSEVMLGFFGEGQRQVSIMNTVGEIIRTVEVQQSQQRFDISGLAPGIYLLRAEENGGKVSVCKLIIQ